MTNDNSLSTISWWTSPSHTTSFENVHQSWNHYSIRVFSIQLTQCGCPYFQLASFSVMHFQLPVNVNSTKINHHNYSLLNAYTSPRSLISHHNNHLIASLPQPTHSLIWIWVKRSIELLFENEVVIVIVHFGFVCVGMCWWEEWVSSMLWLVFGGFWVNLLNFASCQDNSVCF